MGGLIQTTVGESDAQACRAEALGTSGVVEDGLALGADRRGSTAVDVNWGRSAMHARPRGAEGLGHVGPLDVLAESLLNRDNVEVYATTNSGVDVDAKTRAS